MTRTASAGMISHLATATHTRCTMLRIDLADGTTIAVTDHDRALDFDLGDGSVTYSPETGILPSDLSLSTGFEPDEIEVTGPIGDTVTAAAIIGGRFDDATVRHFQANWNSLASGPLRFMQGYVALAEVDGPRFRLQVQSEVAKLSQTIGEVISAYCSADFMDAQCGYSEAALTATVTAVTDERNFSVGYTGTFADNYFNRGTVEFTSGALAGTRPVEIFDFASGGANLGAVALWLGLVQAPEIGDTLEIKRGCGKTRADCMAYGNVVNFRGFPDCPGSDQALKYPNPGGG